MKHLYSAGIVTYTVEDNLILYLLLQYGAGHWDFPKGNIEKGETKEQAAQRELMEETGLAAEIDTHFEETFEYIFTDYPSPFVLPRAPKLYAKDASLSKDDQKQLTKKTVYFFIGETQSKKITLSYEHTDFKWLTYEKAIKKLTYDNAKELLKKAHTYIQKHISKEQL